jgi:hypothetical protein
LVRREKPEIEQRAWEIGMDFPCGKTDEGRERECHLFDLSGESGVFACCEHGESGLRKLMSGIVECVRGYDMYAVVSAMYEFIYLLKERVV